MTQRKWIPVARPVLSGREKEYVLDCLETSWISSLGKYINLFEDSFARFCSTEHAVSCNNGTSALHIALLALGVGEGDEVIVPTLTYIASANAVRYCGGTPVFVDSEPATMNLDPAKIEEKITERTKGILAVHLYGHPADMDPVLRIARAHNLFVLEDAAEAHGALYKDRRVGSLGDAATFSFFGNKIITTGEGGMVTTSNAKLQDQMRALKGQGVDPNHRYWFPIVGYNYRMTNVQAAIGLAQLEQIDEHLRCRQEIAALYMSALSPLEDVLTLPSVQPWASHVFWSYPIVLKDNSPVTSDHLMASLAADGIETRPVFIPVHTMPPYLKEGEHHPVAERLGRNGISLPMHGLLTGSDVEYIAERLAAYCLRSAAAK
jgi:perosamine synthetase